MRQLDLPFDTNSVEIGSTISEKTPPLASSPPSTAGGKFSTVGIYRPPAVRKTLKLSESAIQLAPPAACENPNDYSYQQQYVTFPPAAQSPGDPATAESGQLKPASEGKHSCSTDSERHCPCANNPNSALRKIVNIRGNQQATVDAADATEPLADSNNNNKHHSSSSSSDSKTESSPQQQQPVDSSVAATSQGCQITAGSTRTARSHRERRPDRAVYIPRARRSLTTPPVTVQQGQTCAASNNGSFSTTTTEVFTSGSTSGPIYPSLGPPVTSSSLPKATSKKERSSNHHSEKDSKSKAKDKPPPGGCNSVIENHLPSDSRASSEYSSSVNFKSRSHSVEDSLPAAGTIYQAITLKKQKSEEAPREHTITTQDGDLITKPPSKKESRKERSNGGSILTELNGSTNPRVVDSMNKSNKQRPPKQSPATATGTPLIIGVSAESSAGTTEKLDKDEKELRRASKEINRSNRRIIKQTFASDVLEIAEQEQSNAVQISNGTVKSEGPARELNPEEDDWESIYDDNGDCLNPKLMEELTSAVGKVSIELPRTDYKLYQSKQAALNEEEFPHVLEVSNFPVEFKTQDLMMLFSQYKESGFDIKWVDDTHALAVFSSSKIAAEVLANGHTFVKLKPLAEATVESRSKARKCSSSLQPYRARPETCAALARRLVTTALGVRLKTAPEERENERRVLREAKERKLLAAKQRDEIWES
ncbi:coiled-coil domain-containing protein R3HCC1L isoform X2 [Wyeomyia smithii]|uniref:coiled-coil domain-containing protein R3HCC1L isoform X2 n=1 Tax=Wyeomyia smithii TaxID=174621 RepID=UPI0024680CA7|nr:coiled-coil domain-containing protein R3HCC1L isoform X2 [Wyeomyia smithii]